MNGRTARSIRRHADRLVELPAYRRLGTSPKTLARWIHRVVTRTGRWVPSQDGPR